MEQHLAFYSFKACTDHLGSILSVLMPVNRHTIDCLQPGNQAFPQCIQLLNPLPMIFINLLYGCPQSGTARHVLRPGAHPLLLTSTEYNGPDFYFFINI